MKLKNYIISLSAICALLSCSKDDNTGIEVPGLEPDATLSLAVSADSQTKTKAANPADGIKQLTVLVYIGDAYSTMKNVSAETNTDLTEVTDIPVKAGNVKVLVLANAGANVETLFKDKSLTEALQIKTSNLGSETDGSLTMSSGVMEVSLRASVINCMGYTATPGTGKVSVKDDEVKLYRNVARVQLASLKVTKDTEYGTDASFKLKKIFVVNVKSESLLASETAWGAVEATATTDTDAGGRLTFWWQGGWEDKTGTILTNGTKKDILAYGYVEAAQPAIPTTGGSYELTGAEGAPIGNAFYVYENTTAKGSQTIFVVCGDYTYTPSGKAEETVSDTYYAVTVNEDGTKNTFSGITSHNLIKRNVQYNLNITLSGPGSTNIDPATGVYVNAMILVNAWNAPIIIDGDVE